MTFLALAAAHSRVARRQKALWFTAIPLTAFAALLAVISPARPGTGSIDDLAFSGQMIAMFTGLAYAAAFADFFTAPSRLGIDELEASTPVRPLVLRAARVLGTFGVLVVPSLAILLIMGITQTMSGNLWSIPGALAVTATIIAPAALIAMSLSALAGTLLPRALGRIAGVLIWFFLIFSTPLMPIPTLNGTMLTVNGDAIAAGYFATSPIYPPTGPLAAFDSATWTATTSLIAQLVIILLLLAVGSALAGRFRKR